MYLGLQQKVKEKMEKLESKIIKYLSENKQAIMTLKTNTEETHLRITEKEVEISQKVVGILEFVNQEIE